MVLQLGRREQEAESVLRQFLMNRLFHKQTDHFRVKGMQMKVSKSQDSERHVNFDHPVPYQSTPDLFQRLPLRVFAPVLFQFFDSYFGTALQLKASRFFHCYSSLPIPVNKPALHLCTLHHTAHHAEVNFELSQ